MTSRVPAFDRAARRCVGGPHNGSPGARGQKHTPSPRPLYQHRHQLDGTDSIREGDEGKTFYVISSGTVEVTIKDIGKVAELHEGDYFGERALVADDKRTATCTAIGNDCRVLTLDREDFVALLGSVEDLVQHGTNEEVELLNKKIESQDVTLNTWTYKLGPARWEGAARRGP